LLKKIGCKSSIQKKKDECGSNNVANICYLHIITLSETYRNYLRSGPRDLRSAYGPKNIILFPTNYFSATIKAIWRRLNTNQN